MSLRRWFLKQADRLAEATSIIAGLSIFGLSFECTELDVLANRYACSMRPGNELLFTILYGMLTFVCAAFRYVSQFRTPSQYRRIKCRVLMARFVICIFALEHLSEYADKLEDLEGNHNMVQRYDLCLDVSLFQLSVLFSELLYRVLVKVMRCMDLWLNGRPWSESLFMNAQEASLDRGALLSRIQEARREVQLQCLEPPSLRLCSICWDEPANAMCRPCRHAGTCEACLLTAVEMTNDRHVFACPVCRRPVDGYDVLKEPGANFPSTYVVNKPRRSESDSIEDTAKT